MSRIWLLFGLIALAALACLQALAGPSAPSSVPMIPLGPSQPIQRHAEPIAADPATSDLDAADAPPARVEAAMRSADDRQARVDVRVEKEVAGGRRLVPFVDVVLHSPEGNLPARTDADGRAQFLVRGGDGCTVSVVCPMGARQDVTLSAAAPTEVVLTIRPTFVVKGTVVTASGAPVAGAAIVVLPWQGIGGDEPAAWRVGTSAADGSYEVRLAVGGRIGAHHRVHGPSAMYLVRPQSAAATATLPVWTIQLVLLSMPGEVRGVVRDHRGQAVAGAELEFRSASATPAGAELAAVPQRTRSDASGAYVVTRLLPGLVDCAVRARGHGFVRNQLQLPPGAATTHDVELPPACTLAGNVTFADGTPAADAVVMVDATWSFGAARTTTAADGSFVLADLPPGPLDVSASALDGDSRTRRQTNQRLSLTVAGPNQWNAVLPRGAPANLHGELVDAGGGKLGGWRVVAQSSRDHARNTLTSPDGSFAMAVGDGQPVDLRAYAPGRALNQFADAVRFGVQPAAGPVRIVVGPSEFGSVTGRVETLAQAPVAAAISCWHHERRQNVTATANANGTVLLAEVPPGTIDLWFEHPGHVRAVRNRQNVLPRQRLDLGTIVLGAGGGLFGSVRGPDGSAPADCKIKVVASGEAFQADYNAGTFRFPTLPAGKHVLYVCSDPLAARSVPVTIEVGVEKSEDVVLQAGVRRRLRILVPPDAPGGVGLALRPAQGDMQYLATGGSPKPPGSEQEVAFEAWLAPGTYEAVAWATDGEWVAHRSVPFVSDDDSEIRLELRRKTR